MKLKQNTAVKKIGKILWLILLLFINCAALAQGSHRVFKFEPGDEFEKEIHYNSSCVIQRGKQTLSVISSSSLSKSYLVNKVTDSAYEFMVTIKKMDNRINSLGQELHYNSENAMDTTSKIHKALKYMVGKPSLVSVNKNGIIVSAKDASIALANDTLLTFAGLPEESFAKGNQFGLVADFSPGKTLKKGYTWSDSLSVKKQRMITRFVIDIITDAVTVIKFKSEIKGESLNSNTNGTYILDNKSGLIIQKLIESVITGYQVRDKTVYATTRRISLSEDCKKKQNVIELINWVYH